jgi:hypothetical protein
MMKRPAWNGSTCGTFSCGALVQRHVHPWKGAEIVGQAG